jgi:polyphosphate kinase
MKTKIRAKELSWLSFNARVLQEAADPTVPILERLRFLGIFSSNLDEFFRVRVATLKRLAKLGKKAKTILGYDPKKVLKEIQEKSLAQHRDLDAIYRQLLRELTKERIFIIDDSELTSIQGEFVRDYFSTRVRPQLMPVMLHPNGKFPALRDESIYLAISFGRSPRSLKAKYGLIEVPAIDRFVPLPSTNGNRYFVLLDDVIRFCLKDIFGLFDIDQFEAFTIKVTRDAELDIDNDISESYILKVSKSLKKRKQGAPVRFIYDANISPPLLDFLTEKLRLGGQDTLIPGARYHNFKDFVDFPLSESSESEEAPRRPLPNRRLDPKNSLLAAVAKRDALLHFPYQSFDTVVALFREAALEPHVTSIKTTLYRIAKDSALVNALISAARNGKDVTAVIELQARFDEQANIELANKLQDEGVRVIHGIPQLKIHAKVGLIGRRKAGQNLYYACIGTGNFNEHTTELYSDHCLVTADRRLTQEVKTIFDFLENKYPAPNYKHLIVSPFNVRAKLARLVRDEIKNAKKGREAFIHLKLNNLTDPEMIGLLYQACDAGVKIRLNVRGMFSLLPNQPERKENIEAIGIVDHYLEHSRIMVFCNGGAHQYFLTSADWMPRNLDGRVEVGVPIYDASLQAELRALLDLQWQDNVKARILDQNLENRYRRTNLYSLDGIAGVASIAGSTERVRAQEDFYEVLRNRHTRRTPDPAGSRSAKRAGKSGERPVIPFDPSIKKRPGHPSL